MFIENKQLILPSRGKFMSSLFAHESTRLASFIWKQDIWLGSKKFGQLPESCLVYMIEKPQMSSNHQMFGVVRLTPDPPSDFVMWELAVWFPHC